MISLSKFDLQIDLLKLLDENETAISYLTNHSAVIPPEAFEMRAILRRAVAAEQLLREVDGQVGNSAPDARRYSMTPFLRDQIRDFLRGVPFP